MKTRNLEERANKKGWLHKSREEGSSVIVYRANNKDYIERVLERTEIIPYRGKLLLVEKEDYTIYSEKKDETEIKFEERTNVLGYILLKYDSSYLLSPEKPVLTKYLKSKLRKVGFETQRKILKNKSNIENRKMVSISNYDFFLKS